MDMLQTTDDAVGKRETNRIRNRNAILAAARECFREKGYDNSTIRDIVRRTGLAAGTFYNYFSSKQDIFAALLTDFLNRLNTDLNQYRQTSATARDFIHTTYLALFMATADDPLVYQLAHRNDHAIRDLFGSDLLGLAMLSLEEDIRNAVERELLPDVDQHYLCAAFSGVAYEMSLRVAERTHESPDKGEHEARQAAHFASTLFMGGLTQLSTLS
ncbi:MAG: TetR/AcrR family transcriptional regulator [Marinobacter sp.]|uniref:TetR/AcrR family transcriptional regulator n=1 Tax=Marinobacter sp. NP-4(2019) TaxID=2488665 RepID=UPI000FC3CBD9|nr:TetR/AcrR family transcriptional regulator [Marinobacter sp. NP-4(2019)]AZT84236.1 TetR/AcrR family transcriptional regulator [Marinobacter sp. NP-4(2019)]MCG2581967.1 TetR/AcrR family transcriptional regulator [Marinobacter sp.]